MLVIIRGKAHIAPLQKFFHKSRIAALGDTLIAVAEIVVVIGKAHGQAADYESGKLTARLAPLLFRISLYQFFIYVTSHKAQRLLFKICNLTADFKSALRQLTEAWDHSFIVEEGSLAPQTVACLEEESFRLSFVPFRTTAENFARYFADKLAEQGLPVSQVDVYETPNNCASYLVGA